MRATLYGVIVAALVGIGQSADARITQLQITSQTPAFGGMSFGAVGPYETIIGRASGEVDPNDPLNAVITDVQLAPRNSRGMVQYSMDVVITKPVDLSKGNGTILHDVPNRGAIRSPEMNIGGDANNLGDGFLENQGFTLVDNGWEGDINTGLRITLPVATNPDGSVITGRVRSEYILTSPASTQDLTRVPAYEAVSTNNADATLTSRVHQHDPKEAIPNSQFAFADCSVTPFPGVPSTTKVCLNGGFDTNHIYELVYTAKNPTVMGLGFAATRDLVSFLRYGSAGVTNPLAGGVQNAITYGSSQSGRWIRTYIQLGFNQDEARRLVFEGAIPHKSSNRGGFNVRFAQPTRLSGTQHTEAQYPGAESPSTWAPSFDPLTGISGGVLDRCRATNSCPKIIHTNTDTEYSQAMMSLNTTSLFGKVDVVIPPEVRIYELSGTMHGGGDPTQLPGFVPSTPVNCQLPTNPNAFIPAQRALLVALRQWIVNGTQPPPSMISRISAGSLGPVSQVNYPYVPATSFSLAQVTNVKNVLDRGPLYNTADVSGVMDEPPIVRGTYYTLLPQVDADGNPIDGLRNIYVQVPMGTYTGWNVRKAGFSEGDSCDLTGGYIPFFRTQAQRIAAGDPRLSLEERYPTHADYLAKVTAAANSLVAQRLLLPQDAALAISQANQVLLTCDDSMITAFKPDANTTVNLVKAFKKGDPLALAGTPASPPPPIAANDMCLVKLTVGPGNPGPAGALSTSSGIHIEMWLPSPANWNKRIHNITLGGFGGSAVIGNTTLITAGTAPYLTGVTWGIAMNEGAVSAVNDGGHADPAATGSFAMNPDGTINTTLWTDLATRATHEMTLKTKALVAAYYLAPQSFAYVDGCSGGGRQGFAEAQSFPADYNGILAGAPSIAQTRFFPADLYPGFVQLKDLGSYTALTADQVALVAGSAVSACDTTLTGQHDGYINNPASCTYDPVNDPSVLCTASGGTNSTSSCVSTAQANTFNKAWYGATSNGTVPSPVADNGVNIFRPPGQLWWGEPRGAKFAQAFSYGLTHPTDQIALNLQNSIYARPAFLNATGNGQNGWMTLSYAGFANQLAQGVALNNAFGNIDTENPDLSAFNAAGGKMLSYHGLADPLVAQAMSSKNYYEKVTALVGGYSATQQFYRLFLVPGMGHCAGVNSENGVASPPANPPLLQGTQAYDALTKWVESGTPPSTITVTTADATRSRPLCLYPKQLTYVGGDVNAAASFSCN
jgi:feruloyl esterase